MAKSPATEAENRRTIGEKLLALKDCSSETRVLSFKQTEASCSSGGKTPGKCKWFKCAPSCQLC